MSVYEWAMCSSDRVRQHCGNVWSGPECRCDRYRHRVSAETCHLRHFTLMSSVIPSLLCDVSAKGGGQAAFERGECWREFWPRVMSSSAAEPHAADRAALSEWHYPSDAEFRRYQFDAVLASLRANVLVSFPTGLGKTLVGAVVMYNFLRWFPRSLVVFVAPTRPLVAQQLDAVVESVPVGRANACLLTGDVAPSERAAIYATRKALFTTAQVLANDLLSGACPAHRISLLVLDEAHHAQGDHACVALLASRRVPCGARSHIQVPGRYRGVACYARARACDSARALERGACGCQQRSRRWVVPRARTLCEAVPASCVPCEAVPASHVPSPLPPPRSPNLPRDLVRPPAAIPVLPPSTAAHAAPARLCTLALRAPLRRPRRRSLC